jgi:hypothetical protein
MGGGASKNTKAFKKTEVERYISLGRTSIIRNQKRASDGLERISRTGGEEATNAIVELGGMQVITTQLANSKSSNVRLKSAMILANVSKYDKIRLQLFDERVCLCLVDLISLGKPVAMRPFCIEGIANMAILPEARPDLLGATPNIIKFIYAGNLSEQLAGLNALRRVAGHTKCHFKMSNSGTITVAETILLSQFHTNMHKCFAMQVGASALACPPSSGLPAVDAHPYSPYHSSEYRATPVP